MCENHNLDRKREINLGIIIKKFQQGQRPNSLHLLKKDLCTCNDKKLDELDYFISMALAHISFSLCSTEYLHNMSLSSTYSVF